MLPVLAVLQARMSSSRFPGKILVPLLGRPMLHRQIERVLRAGKITEVVVATSTDVTDDAVESLCRRIGIRCFRGSLEDVLDRFYCVAKAVRPQHIVRLTGDCPLADPDVIDTVIGVHLDGRFDYTSNVNPPTFPDGLDVEVLRFESLETAWKEATLPSEREHVTSFIRNHPERFSTFNVASGRDLSQLRWTVDEPDDLQFVERVYSSLLPQESFFSMNHVLRLLEVHPEIQEINASHRRNEGYLRSLEKDGRLVP